jgi:GNAT superfamily N-acetyltransferase
VTAASIRRLTDESDHPEIIAVAARAFWHDPLFDFLTDDLLAEYGVLPRVFRAAMTDFRVGGAELYVADVSGRPRSFAGWLGPGSFPRDRRSQMVRNLRALALLRRLRHRRAAAALLQEVERRHPSEAHWYLGLLATDPTAQGRGIGTALLRPVLDRCDADGVPAYTETQKWENVAWYRRSGFAAVDEIRLPGTPTIWRLWRDPQGV